MHVCLMNIVIKLLAVFMLNCFGRLEEQSTACLFMLAYNMSMRINKVTARVKAWNSSGRLYPRLDEFSLIKASSRSFFFFLRKKKRFSAGEGGHSLRLLAVHCTRTQADYHESTTCPGVVNGLGDIFLPSISCFFSLSILVRASADVLDAVVTLPQLPSHRDSERTCHASRFQVILHSPRCWLQRWVG